MSCINLSPEITQTLSATANTTRYAWFTDWASAAGAGKVKYVLKNLNAAGTFTSQLAMQIAEVRSNVPDAPSTLGTAKTGAGEQVEAAIDISSSTSANGLVRFGIAYSSTVNESVDVSLQVCLEVTGKTLPTKKFDLVSPTNSSNYVVVSDWLPVPMASKAKAIFIIQQPTAGFRCRLAYRFADTSVQSPLGWNYQEQTPHSSGELCTPEYSLTPPASNPMWVQLGVEYFSSTASVQSAYVIVTPMIKK